jgi:hypothetical protein
MSSPKRIIGVYSLKLLDDAYHYANNLISLLVFRIASNYGESLKALDHPSTLTN